MRQRPPPPTPFRQVENTPNLAKIIPRKVIATVAADAAITLPIDVNAFLTALIRIRTLPQIVVIAADEEDGVIRSRAGHHPAQEDDGLVRDTQAEWAETSHDGLRHHQRDADRDQRQQHGDHVPVDDQQDDEQQDGDRELDPNPVVLTGGVEVGDGDRGSGDVDRERRCPRCCSRRCRRRVCRRPCLSARPTSPSSPTGRIQAF